MNLEHWNLINKKVFVRIDGNVPLKNGLIQNDFRLKAILPTLELLKNKGALITLATHLGRPQGNDPLFSTQPLKQWLAHEGYASITVLENLRFNAGERNHSPAFAQELAQGMDYYVNDAWGLMHRNDTSITLLPQLFPPERRSFGLLVKNEIASLDILKNSPQQPYIVILGGGKDETKLPVIEHLLEHKHPQTIIVLPALAATFAKALGQPIGLSSFNSDLVQNAARIMQKAHEKNCTLVLPVDYTYVEDTWSGSLKTCDAKNFPENGIAMSVGPCSLELYKKYLTPAKTIFFNGAMGNPSRTETMHSLHELLAMIAASPGYSVIGGGSSIAELEQLSLLDKISYCSTGGGATLVYISDGEMPGITAMEEKTL